VVVPQPVAVRWPVAARWKAAALWVEEAESRVADREDRQAVARSSGRDHVRRWGSFWGHPCQDGVQKATFESWYPVSDSNR
jgi:hypothetical protein